MFYVGDIVRCIQSRSIASNHHIKGLMHYQRFEVSRAQDWHDGSQSLWIIARPKSQKTNREPPDPGERGPYCSLRFSLEDNPNGMFRYDPSQLGDLDDGI